MQTYEAAVVGASLVSFIPGISLGQRKAVKLATLWAETVTLQDMAKETAQEQYQYYRKKLMYLGWDAKSAEEVHWPDPERPKIVDQALSKIDAIAGARHSSHMALALEALKKNGKPLLHFESRSKDRAQFQLLSCAPVSGNYVDIVVYHEAGNVALNAALWAAYADEELAAIHNALVASIAPQEMLGIARWMLLKFCNANTVYPAP